LTAELKKIFAQNVSADRMESGYESGRKVSNNSKNMAVLVTMKIKGGRIRRIRLAKNEATCGAPKFLSKKTGRATKNPLMTKKTSTPKNPLGKRLESR